MCLNFVVVLLTVDFKSLGTEVSWMCLNFVVVLITVDFKSGIILKD